MAQQSATIDIDGTRSSARRYMGVGWVPIAYQHQTKAPLEKNWEKKTLDKVDVDKAFTGNNSNVGVLLGAPSGNLVDVDLDSAEAIELAPIFLPQTDKRFGRPATPDAHWLYRADVPATVPFNYTGKKDGMLVELRSTGGQTMFPPSVHPCGERLSWAEDGELPEVDGAELLQRVQRLALASLIMRHWQDGLRNVLGLRVPGALLTHGWTEAEVEKLIRIVATKCGDDPAAIEKSISRLRYTVERLKSGRKCTGIPKLAESLNISPDTLRSWVDMRPEEERGILSSSEPIHVARAFSKTLNDTWHWRSDFYQWDGSWWTKVDQEELKGRLYPWLEQQKVKTQKGITPLAATRNLVADVLSALAGVMQLSNLAETPFWINPTGKEPKPSDLIPFRNGVFNLNTWQLMKPDQRLFTLHGVDCDYDPDAKSPTWQRFMVDIFPEDAGSAPCIEEICGYCITSDRSLQKAFALIGDKRSGKSTIGRLLRVAVGPGRFINPKLHDFSETFGAENLIGKTVAVIADQRGTGKGSHTVENILSITGQDPQSIRRMYKGHWNGLLPTCIVLISNGPPKLTDPTGVVITRFIVISFTESFFGRENLTLTDELIAEMPGIINIWLDGYKRLKQRGRFLQPESGLEYLDQMDENAGTVKRFVSDMCAVDREYEISKSMLYDRFNEWAKDHGHHSMADSTFASDLLGLHIGVKPRRHRNPEGKFVPYFAGITLTDMVPTGGKVTPNQAAMLYKDAGYMPSADMIDPEIPF
ncbi:phage/plasmid primase, P4 family [Mesorhizobium sp. M0106]|uniref:phage/plasmid primase, P4 family n=1 Tax=Mesorhizobium sp. M0106 TaxID=2956880 RepID=UPI00333B975C